MLDFLIMLFSGPFLLVSALADNTVLLILSILVTIVGAGCIGYEDYCDKHQNYWFACWSCIALLVLFLIPNLIDPESLSVVQLVITFIGTIISYFLYGIFALLLIWPLAKRKHIRLTRRLTKEFNSLSSSLQNENIWKRTLSENNLNESTYKFPSARSSEGKLKILMFVSVWHVYLLDLSIGGFLRELPDLVSKLIGKTLDKISVYVGDEAEIPVFSEDDKK